MAAVAVGAAAVPAAEGATAETAAAGSFGCWVDSGAAGGGGGAPPAADGGGWEFDCNGAAGMKGKPGSKAEKATTKATRWLNRRTI